MTRFPDDADRRERALAQASNDNLAARNGTTVRAAARDLPTRRTARAVLLAKLRRRRGR